MPAPTTYTPPPPVNGDLFVRLEITREGEHPTIACVFRPVADVSGTNALGNPLYPPVGQSYTLFLDSSRPLALMQIATLMQGVQQRVAAGEDIDSALANEAYDLLALCVAKGSSALILSDLGVSIPSEYNPFPA